MKYIYHRKKKKNTNHKTCSFLLKLEYQRDIDSWTWGFYDSHLMDKWICLQAIQSINLLHDGSEFLNEQFWSIMHQQIIWLDIHTDHGPLTKQKVRLQRANHGESKKMSPWAKLGQSTDHQSHMYIGKKPMVRIQFTVPIGFIKRKRAYIV